MLQAESLGDAGITSSSSRWDQRNELNDGTSFPPELLPKMKNSRRIIFAINVEQTTAVRPLPSAFNVVYFLYV